MAVAVLKLKDQAPIYFEDTNFELVESNDIYYLKGPKITHATFKKELFEASLYYINTTLHDFILNDIYGGIAK